MKSQLTGLIANALGYGHGDWQTLNRLQARLRYAVRRDRTGIEFEDYQTVDLSQPHMQCGWTTWGLPAERKGAFSGETHIRHRRYWADSVLTVAVALDPADEVPDIDQVGLALQCPERPLFIGRKCCLPASNIFLGWAEDSTLTEALVRAQPLSRGADQRVSAWIPPEEATGRYREGRWIQVWEQRDWLNQLHTGRGFVWETQLELEMTS